MPPYDKIDDFRANFPTPETLSRRGFVVTSLAAGFAVSTQPVAAQTAITTDAQGLIAGEVQIPTASGNMVGYRAKPAAGTRFATVIVVHEVFGAHEYLRDVCRRLAKLGYQAIVPELFARQGNVQAAPDIQAVMGLVNRKPYGELMSDLDATARFAVADGGEPGRLGITGFCWGGRAVWLYAAHNKAVKAGVSWYGHLGLPVNDVMTRNPLSVVADVSAPVLGLYGGNDTSIPLAQIEQAHGALRNAGKATDFFVYPGVGHAFHADYRASYNEAAAKDGWNKMQAWFARYLA